MFGQNNFFDFRRWLTNIWLCRLRGVFSTKRPKYLGKSAYTIPSLRGETFCQASVLPQPSRGLKISCQGPLNGVKFCCRGPRNGVTFCYQRPQNGVKFNCRGPQNVINFSPKNMKILFYWKFFCLKIFLEHFPTKQKTSWAFGQHNANCANPPLGL